MATVDRLLDTAAALFWEKGYAATTTREIAAAVGIQQASLYYHMQNKEDLLYQICISSLKQFLADVPAAAGAVAAADRIAAIIHSHVATLLSHQERNVAMLTELRSLSRRHRVEVVELRERYAAFLGSALTEAQAAGRIRSDIPAAYLTLALLNIVNWSALWFRKGQALSAEALADLLSKIYLEGVTAGVRGSRPGPDLTTAKPSRGRKPARSQENSTLQRLLAAAVALFSRKGYTATSTREVAALIGIQKASLYYHIQSKEDLLYLICKSSLERIHKDVEASMSGVEDPLERIRALIRAHVESMLRDAEEHSTTLAEMHALSPRRLTQVVSLRDAYEDLVRSVIQSAQKTGAVRADIDAKYLSLSALGLMNRVLVWYRRGGPLSPVQIGELLAAVFIAGADSTGR